MSHIIQTWGFDIGYPNSDVEDDTFNSPNVDDLEDALPTSETAETNGLFRIGFSDDESKDSVDPFDSSFQPAKSKPSKKGKKSPRRSENEDLDDRPKTKKARDSLFVGEFQQSSEDADDEEPPKKSLSGDLIEPLVEANDDSHRKSPDRGIDKGMFSLDLTQDEEEDDQGFAGTADIPGEGSPDPSEQGDALLSRRLQKEYDSAAYKLRTNVDRNINSTYLDVDQSGNYDPEEKAKKAQQKKAKAKEARSKAKQKGKQAKEPKERVKKLICRLPFSAIGTVLNVTDGQQNWPEDWSEVDSEEEREQLARKALWRKNTPGVEAQIPIPDPADLEDDLTGHPAARGCVECRQHEEGCSMVEGGTWPCSQCTKDDRSCVPIITPEEKGKCVRCRETCEEDEENYCSHEMTNRPPHDVCDLCAETGETCEPGPPEGYRFPRIDLELELYGPNRKHLTCTQCRTNGWKCSLKKFSDQPPCRKCKKSKIGCTFYDLPKVEVVDPKKARGKEKKAGKGKKTEKGESSKDSATAAARSLHAVFSAEELLEMEDEPSREPVRESTPELQMEDAQGHQGVSARISTCFAHPIEFSCSAETDVGCNFCELPVFGFVGHWEKKVYVIRWSNGLGFTEIHGGHREEFDPTRVCESCILDRVQIILCPGHEMKRNDCHKSEAELGAAQEALLEAEPGSVSMRTELQRWCSMCFTLATFNCCFVQPSISATDASITGCGLNLCDECEQRLRLEFKNDTHEMATVLDKEPRAKEDDDEAEGMITRADVGFLRKDGLLMRNVERAAEMMEPEENESMEFSGEMEEQ